MRGMLPAARDLSIEWRWGGPLERTQHGIPWVGVLGRHRNVCYGMGSRATASRPPTSSAARWLRSCWSWGTTTPAPRWSPSRPRICHRSPSAPQAPAPCAAPIERCEVSEDAGRKPDPCPERQALPERLDAQGSDAVARGRDGLSPCRQRRRHAEVASARNTHLGDKDHGGDGECHDSILSTSIHKAIRAMVYDASGRLQTADFADGRAAAETSGHLVWVLSLMESTTTRRRSSSSPR